MRCDEVDAAMICRLQCTENSLKKTEKKAKSEVGEARLGDFSRER